MLRKKVLAGIALAALPLGAAAARADIAGHCAPVTRMSYAVVDTDNFATDSRHFVLIPKTTVSFTQHGTMPGCVVVRFAAETRAPDGTFMIVRPVLQTNGLVPLLAKPSEAWLSGNDAAAADLLAYGARSFEFVFPSVNPGPHAIVMQMRSLNAHVVVMGKATTMVHHR